MHGYSSPQTVQEFLGPQSSQSTGDVSPKLLRHPTRGDTCSLRETGKVAVKEFL